LYMTFFIVVPGRCSHKELYFLLQRYKTMFGLKKNWKSIIIRVICAVTDKKFLAFFFKHLKKNATGRYMEDFPFLSICGVERNYVRCDDLPLVFTKVIQRHNAETSTEKDWFSYAHADELLMVISQS